ncbi:alpha/beta fold hydrolase [Alteraurantiacibacter aquimixticola]|nr:alpha/beta hydrolase [Alteraurantiacibacter aquimixticola]
MTIGQWSAADDWPLRSFALPAHGHAAGSLLFLGGRGDFFEKYVEAIEHWATRGWNVAGFDWRGQGGSGRLHPEGLCHIDDFAQFLGDLGDFWADWRSSSSGPHIAIGHSMGAHILLRAAAEERIAPDGIVLLSPMIGIRAGPVGAQFARRIARIGNVPGLRHRPVWKGSGSPMPGRITSCPVRHAEKLWWKAHHPDLARGAPSWGWVAAAGRSMATLDPLLRARRLEVPGLILSARRDPVIDLQSIRAAHRELPHWDYGVIDNAGHELLREQDLPRHECLHRIDSFLDRQTGKHEPTVSGS